MSVEITTLQVDNIADLDADTVSEQTTILTELWQSQNPSVDLAHGVAYSLIVLPASILATSTIDLIDQWRRSTQLLELAASTEEIDSELLDAAAANYRITRLEGTEAQGTIKIVLSQRYPVTIAAGATFTAAGLTFVTESSFSAKLTQDAVLSETDRYLETLPTGSHGFNIDVVAAEVGTEGNVTQGTDFTPSAAPAYFLESYATETFIGGTDAESDAALASKAINGITQPILCGRAHMSAMLMAESDFGDVTDNEVIGLGDIELLRDQHSVFPGSFGGRADWYIRSSEQTVTRTVEATATLVSVNSLGQGTWSITIGRDVFPGFYRVRSITIPDTDDTFTPATESRSYDISAFDDGEFVPDIEAATEAAFTRFQTVTITFLDTVTDHGSMSPGDTATYEFNLEGLPQLDELQSFVSSRSVQNFGGDVLVRAPVPCWVSVNIRVQLPYEVTQPTASTIQNAVAGVVNGRGINNTLPVSLITRAVQDLLPDGAYLERPVLNGLLKKLDGTTQRVSASDTMTIEEEPHLTNRTVAFFSSTDDIFISFTRFSE